MAIKIRFSAFKKEDAPIEYPINEGNLLSEELQLLLETSRPDIKEKADELFNVTVNGLQIPSDMWQFTKLRKDDSVFVVPALKTGDSNSLLRLGVILAVSYFTAGAGASLFGAGTFGAWATTAAIGIVGTYAAFQLFPPPVIGPNEVGGASNYSGSQMYSITNQSNAVKKYGNVPRVYGRHRMYPVVAANPYVELEADPVTGHLSQYLYAIYDFGFGPNLINNLKIGNTPIENFTDVTYNLVDFNKPTTSEGVWDDALKSTLSLYKGDTFTESIGVALNGNQNVGDPASDWQIIRNANINPDGLKQEIILNFVLPRGLYSFDSYGNVQTRTILSTLEFSKVSDNNWKSFNGPDVDKWSATGAGVPPNVDLSDYQIIDYIATTIEADIGSFPFTRSLVYPTTGWIYTRNSKQKNFGGVVIGSIRDAYKDYFVGIPAGSTYVDLPTAAIVTVGSILQFKNQTIGIVQSIANQGTGKRYYLVSPTTEPIVLQTIRQNAHAEQNATIESGITGYTLASASPIQYAYPASTLQFSAASTDAVFATVKFTPSVASEYKVRFSRNQTYSTYSTSMADELTLSSLNTRTENNPIVTTKRHTFLEIRIKATGQLNGQIQNMSAEVTSVLPVWTGSEWEKQPSNNPAWIFADILCGEVNKRPVDLNRIDTASLLEWANFCDEIPDPSPTVTYEQKRYESSFILDFDATVQSLTSKVANAAQASFNIIDGKYGVLIDRRQSTPVQLFTPRNSNNFQSQRGYSEKPNGLKVTYVDPASDWQPQEVIVYDNGFDADNAETFEEITTFGITALEQASRFGRYFLAQNRLRQETISIDVDFEYMVCTRGDFVQYVQPSMKAGGIASRVKKVVGNRVWIDEGVESEVGVSYGYVFRNVDTGISTASTLTIVSSNSFDLDGDIPSVDDLFIFGEVGKIVYDCIVKSIQPKDDFAATLILVERADAIFDIDSVDALPDYSANLSRTLDPDISPPPEVENLAIIANTYNILQSGYEYYMDLDWDPPTGSAFEFFEIYVDNGADYKYVTAVDASEYRYIVDQNKLGIDHKFKVVAVSATGNKLTLGEVGFVEDTPLPKTTPPSDVTPFNSDITGEVLQLFWNKIPDLDALSYIIRYSPSNDGSWETSTILNRVSHPTDLYATQARTGLYLIKAIDFAGNESANAAAIYTTIPQLFGLNVIQTTNDFPTLPGVKSSVEILGESLILTKEFDGPPGTEQYYSQGYYYYQDLLDLGDIFTVRLQSLLQAEGFVAEDLMINWVTLDDVDLLYSPGSSDWDVQAEYRATNSLNVIADWVTLSSIVAMTSGSEDQFTEWRRFNIGDATGRIFQFRLSLISNKASVTPRVLNGVIKADMPDRDDAFNNVASSGGVATVTYDPAFKGPGTSPAVSITLENGQSGDYWQFTSKTLTGFTIAFFDKNNLAVDRTFDARAKGYGRRSTASI